MDRQIDLAGVPTWYAEHGAGEPLVLLHPGGVGIDSRAFGSVLADLAAGFRVYTPDRRAHGRTPDVGEWHTYEPLADDTAAFLRDVVGGPAHLLGYSDGAVVALLTALAHPDLVRRLVLVAGVFHRDGWLPQVLEADQAEPPLSLVESYAQVSPDGAAHASAVARKLARLHASGPRLAPDDLATVGARTLVMLGDDDEVSFEHAVALYRCLPDAELAVVPGTSHGLMVEKPQLCIRMVTEFLAADPVPTLAPIRRAPSEPDPA